MKECPCIKSMKNKEEYEVIDDPVLKKDLCEEKKYFICDFCYEFINKKKNKIEHEKRCHKKFFLKKYKKFFDYVFNLVLKNNKKNSYENLLSQMYDKNVLIKDYLIKNITDENKIAEIEKQMYEKDFVKQNYNILIKILNESDLKNKKEKYEILKDLNIKKNKNTDKILKLINITEYNLIPLISFRELVFLFIKKYDIENDLIINYITKRYNRKDWLTDEEIQKIGNDLFLKIENIRKTNEEYSNSFSKFCEILEGFYCDSSKFECLYCKKYIMNKFKHYKRCKEAEEKFNENKALFIYNFDDKYFGQETLKKVNEREIIKKYLDKDYKFFIENIYENIKNPVNFENNYEKKIREQAYQKNNLKNIDKKKMERINGSYFTLSIIIEIEFDCKIDKEGEAFIKQNMYDEFYVKKNKNYKEAVKQNFKEYLNNKNEEIKSEDKKNEIKEIIIEKSEENEDEENEEFENEEISEAEEEESDEENDDDKMLVEKTITEDDQILAEKTITEEDDKILAEKTINEEESDQILEEKTKNNEEKNTYEKKGQVYNINNEEIEKNWEKYYSKAIVNKRKKANKNTETKYITKK